MLGRISLVPLACTDWPCPLLFSHDASSSSTGYVDQQSGNSPRFPPTPANCRCPMAAWLPAKNLTIANSGRSQLELPNGEQASIAALDLTSFASTNRPEATCSTSLSYFSLVPPRVIFPQISPCSQRHIPETRGTQQPPFLVGRQRALVSGVNRPTRQAHRPEYQSRIFLQQTSASESSCCTRCLEPLLIAPAFSTGRVNSLPVGVYSRILLMRSPFSSRRHVSSAGEH